jgi:two-component system CheB/CheR fusion protein
VPAGRREHVPRVDPREHERGRHRPRQHLKVESWNALAEDLWALRTTRRSKRASSTSTSACRSNGCAGQSRTCPTGATHTAEVTVDAVNRRGKAFRCKITASPLQRDGEALGVILLMENGGT